MQVLDCPPAVSSDARAAAFTLSLRGRQVEGAIARDALEENFWLTRRADATRPLKTIGAGRNRIVAVAQRKFLALTTAYARCRSRIAEERPKCYTLIDIAAFATALPHSSSRCGS